jgi:hypothetical protein
MHRKKKGKTAKMGWCVIRVKLFCVECCSVVCGAHVELQLRVECRPVEFNSWKLTGPKMCKALPTLNAVYFPGITTSCPWIAKYLSSKTVGL